MINIFKSMYGHFKTILYYVHFKNGGWGTEVIFILWKTQLYLLMVVTVTDKSITILKIFKPNNTVYIYSSFFYQQTQRTPLHWASSGGHTDIARMLLSLDVPVDARDEVLCCVNYRTIINTTIYDYKHFLSLIKASWSDAAIFRFTFFIISIIIIIIIIVNIVNIVMIISGMTLFPLLL